MEEGKIYQRWSKYLDRVDIEVSYKDLDTFEFRPGTHILSEYNGLPVEIRRGEYNNYFTIIIYDEVKPNGGSCALQHMIKSIVQELWLNSI